MKILQQRRMPMPDGVQLAMDIYLPSGPGPFPIVLTRSCYHRIALEYFAHRFVNAGYGFVGQDVRGKWGSQGEFNPIFQERADGHATLDWIANASWCDGNIAMWGESYLGMLQIPAAAGGHEALKAIAPSVAPASFFQEWLRYDGCLAWANLLYWGFLYGSCSTTGLSEHIQWDELFKLGQFKQIEDAFGFESSFVRNVIQHDTDDKYWQTIDSRRMYQDVRTPAYHSGGWYDHISRGIVEGFCGLQKYAATPVARNNQHLVMGPWGHMAVHIKPGVNQSRYGQWSFTDAAYFDTLAHELRFFDRHLRGIDHAPESAARLFIMGRNQWQTFHHWPQDNPAMIESSWHLTGGDELSLQQFPPSQSTAASYTYDPADPCPTSGGPVFWWFKDHGPIDQRSLLGRQDVLSYRSSQLVGSLCVVGEPWLDLALTINVPDTDICAKLSVEKLDGAVMLLTVGSLRLRYRKSFSQPMEIVPGQVEHISLRFQPTAYEFAAGERIHLLVTSSDYPRILPHTNTYASTYEQLSGHVQPQKARVSIHHDNNQGSRLRLPVVNLD